MKGIFCSTTAKTDGEYREYLKKRIAIFIVLGIIGLATIIAVLLTNQFAEDSLNDHSKSYLIGAGSGIIFASVILIIKNCIVMNDSEKLRRVRIQVTDERNIQIGTAAMKVTLAVMFFVSYVIMFVGCFYSMILTKIMSLIICTVILAYFIAYKVLSKKF